MIKTHAPNGLAYAIHNPHDKPLADLPVIYGFANGGNSFGMHGDILAEDGTGLGCHFCSSEGYMLSDLGCTIKSRPDRHEDFQKHYPDGYRMEFVSYDDVPGHAGLMQAIERAKQKVEAK